MNDAEKAPKVAKERDLESTLNASQTILDRICKIDERLGMMSGRLYGERPRPTEAACGEPQQDGIIGRFEGTHNSSCRCCESIEGWLASIENAV